MFLFIINVLIKGSTLLTHRHKYTEKNVRKYTENNFNLFQFVTEVIQKNVKYKLISHYNLIC